MRLSGLRSAYVEMIATRGQPPWGSRDPRQAVNQFYAFAVPYVWIANDAQRERGLNLVVSEVQRIPASSVDPRAKNYHWNDLTMGLLGALDAGGDTVVLTDGSKIIEDIVTLDDGLRRIQYRAGGGDLPIEDHLGTVDVFAIDDRRSLVAYSTEIEPAEMAEAFHAAIEEAVAAFRQSNAVAKAK